MKARLVRVSLLLAAGALLLPGALRAQEPEEAGHMHGPDGRHIAVAETFGLAYWRLGG